MSYAVVAGHNEIIPGAAGNGYQEHVVARQVKDRVIHYLCQLGETAHDCTDDVGRNKTQVWMNAAKNCNKAIGKNGYIIAIHLNSNGGNPGTGTEVLDYKGTQKAFCQRISARLAKEFAWKDRGWKDGSGIGLIEETEAPVIYIELCFINNISDITKLIRNIDTAAIAIAEEITGKKVAAVKSGSGPYKVIIPNTAVWQTRGLVEEFTKRGYKAYGWNGKNTFSNGLDESDPFMFIIETDSNWGPVVVQELKNRGYDRTYGEAI